MRVMVLPLAGSRLGTERDAGWGGQTAGGGPPGRRLEPPAGASHRERGPAVINCVFRGEV